MAKNGLIIAGLSSGSGKTTVTLGLIRALCRQKAGYFSCKMWT
jgi:cobyrinic acid a,c-diamide synthase